MKLTLNYHDDVRPECKPILLSRGERFEHLTDQAQQALRIVGQATMWHKDMYHVIFPPEDTPQTSDT